jgi:micrococcal nuclease
MRPMFRRMHIRGGGMRLLVLLLAAGAVAAVIAWLSGEGEVQPEQPTPAAFTQAPDTTPFEPARPSTTSSGATTLLLVDRSRLEPATVLNIVDGDTIDVSIAGREERVRFYGVDTTERGEDCFREAADRVEELAGGRVLLLPDARERDSFGRLLRYVFTNQVESIDARLIAEGLGRAWREDGAYREELIALEGLARAASVGCLW